MGLQKMCIGLLLGMIVLTGCGQGDTNSDYDQNENIVSQQDGTDRQDENDEVYYCDIVNASVSKYPELNTTDIAINEHGWGPMIVSPYASDDVIRAVTHVICDTGVSTYCYGNCLYSDRNDDFTGYDFEAAYEIIQSRVYEARLQSDAFNQQLIASLENDPEIKISPSGEYYYILDMENFEKSAIAIKDSVDRQSEMFDFDMRDYYDLYFKTEGRNFIGGYRGISYAVYSDTYSPDNKIYEYYYWRRKNEWLDIYSELYRSAIYDYSKINEKLSEQSQSTTHLTCSCSTYERNSTVIRNIEFQFRMWTGEFKPEEAIELAYEVYTNVRNGNEEYNTDKISGIQFEMDNFSRYEQEYNKVSILVPFDKEYSLEEFEKIIMDNIVIACDAPPV